MFCSRLPLLAVNLAFALIVFSVSPFVFADCMLHGIYSTEVEFGDPPEGLLRIDPLTGQGEQIGLLDAVMFPFGLAAIGDELYTFDQVAHVVRRLDPADGKTVEVFDVGIQERGEGSIALGRDGTGYLSGRKLYRFDLSNGTSEVVGELERMDGLTIGPDGTLYGLQESSYDLLVIDPDTAEATIVGPTGISIGGFNATGGLAFGPDGMLYAANDSALYVVNPLTAESRHVGNVGWNDVQGITFIGCDEVGPVPLQAGDANQDLQFNGADLARVLAAAKYLTGHAATWGEGDWNGAPGGSSGSPPAGNGLFDQFDIVAALQSGVYLTGPYQALRPDGNANDEQVSLVYNSVTGEVAVDVPGDSRLAAVEITANTAIVARTCVQPSSICLEIDGPILTRNSFSGSFGSFSFGAIAQPGLDEELLLNDVTMVGSFAEGREIGDVRLVYVPEPATAVLAILGVLAVVRPGQFRVKDERFRTQ